MSAETCVAVALVAMGIIALCALAERLRDDDDDGPASSGGAWW
jgi:hypothetical protein